MTGGQAANAPASVITNSVDAFNPADNSVSPVAPMTIRRWSHTATTLADGRVLVTGGRTGSTSATGVVLATAEIYDPATNAWTETAGAMSVGRRSHAVGGHEIGERRDAEAEHHAGDHQRDHQFQQVVAALAGAAAVVHGVRPPARPGSGPLRRRGPVQPVSAGRWPAG